jgi:lysophospholipase
MSYTSSAISMLLENLGKPVILTGAQVPLSELRNDAIENVLGALILASSHPIAEVTLFFASTLYRGNRVSKLSNSSLNAFDSPNLAPLATAGISIQVNEALVRKPTHLVPFRAHNQMSQQVVLLRLFPGLQVETIASFFKAPIRGVILHSFGAGNAPTRPDLLQVLQQATKERGIVIVNISQCIRGEVSSIYEVGKKLEAVGVVAGGDMTPEAALTKLEYLLGKDDLSIEEVRVLMGRSLRGELTERRHVDEDYTKDEEAGAKSLLQKVIVDQDGHHPIPGSDDSLDSLAIDAERALLPCE